MTNKPDINKSKEEELNRFIKRLPWSAFKIGLLFLAPYLILFRGGLSTKQSDWAAFGDFIGGVMGVVIGLLTLMVLGLAYTTQRQELKETRNELKLAREEAARSSEALLMQVKMTQYEQIVKELVNSTLQLDKQFTDLLEYVFILPGTQPAKLRSLIKEYGDYDLEQTFEIDKGGNDIYKGHLKEFREVVRLVNDLKHCINSYQRVYFNQPYEVPMPNATVRYIKRKWIPQLEALKNWHIVDKVTFRFFENDEWNTKDYYPL